MRVAVLTTRTLHVAARATAIALLASSVGLAGVVAVSTPRRRGGAGVESARLAADLGLDHWVVPEANEAATADLVRAEGFDVVVAMGVGILRPVLLDVPGVDFVNAHAGRVPRYRGRSPSRWAILNGDPVFATVHRMDAGIDTGDVLLEEPLDIGRPTTLRQLRDLTMAAQWSLVPRALEGFADGTLVFTPQPADPRSRQWFGMHQALGGIVESKLRDGSAFEIQDSALAAWRAPERAPWHRTAR